MRKTHPALLKFKVALAALTGQPVVDICKQFEIAESLVHKWKKQLKEQGVTIFTSNSKSVVDTSADIDKLHQVIGKLTTNLQNLNFDKSLLITRF